MRSPRCASSWSITTTASSGRKCSPGRPSRAPRGARRSEHGVPDGRRVYVAENRTTRSSRRRPHCRAFPCGPRLTSALRGPADRRESGRATSSSGSRPARRAADLRPVGQPDQGGEGHRRPPDRQAEERPPTELHGGPLRRRRAVALVAARQVRRHEDRLRQAPVVPGLERAARERRDQALVGKGAKGIILDLRDTLAAFSPKPCAPPRSSSTEVSSARCRACIRRRPCTRERGAEFRGCR